MSQSKFSKLRRPRMKFFYGQLSTKNRPFTRPLLRTNLLDVKNSFLACNNKKVSGWERGERRFCKEMNSKPEFRISSCYVKFCLSSVFLHLSSIIQDRSQTCSSSKWLIKEYKKVISDPVLCILFCATISYAAHVSISRQSSPSKKMHIHSFNFWYSTTRRTTHF
jgi:hypothetical protein